MLNNTDSINPFASGRLGGFQGGGPNVIGIICAIYCLLCVHKLIISGNIRTFLLEDKLNALCFLYFIINLIFTFSRGSYLALFIGLLTLIMFSEKIDKDIKTYFVTSLSLIVIFSIFLFPSIFLKTIK